VSATVESVDIDSFRDTLKSFVRNVITPAAVEADASGEPPLLNYRKAAELGLAGLCIPVEYGGSDATQHVVSAALEEIARGCASTAMILMGPIVVGELIAYAGDDATRANLLPGIAAGTTIPAMAITEPDAGSDIRAIRTTVTSTGDGLLMNGSKTYITNGSIADVFVVFAKEQDATGRDISAFIVNADTAGVVVGRPLHKLGLHASATTEIAFVDVALTDDDRLGAAGSGASLAISALDRARLNTAAQAVGIAGAALDHVTEFARSRVQFGQTIRDYQAIQIRVAEMHVQLSAARTLLRSASIDFDELPPGRARATSAATAKVFCSDTASQLCNQAVILLGGFGYMREAVVERLLRDCKGTQIYDGTNDINRMTIGRNLLSD
jgi:alkylation response protein AidB-like acyl-CoA dehydrogenase